MTQEIVRKSRILAVQVCALVGLLGGWAGTACLMMYCWPVHPLVLIPAAFGGPVAMAVCGFLAELAWMTPQERAVMRKWQATQRSGYY